jgi:DNA polymerase I-like protein with 3'-5' exonuclease and polymerase domains
MFRQSPGIKDIYWKGVEHEIRENHYLRSSFGRLRRFWLVTPENWKDIKKEGYNFKPQADASDLTLRSLIRLYPRIKHIAIPLITVHDELTFMCKRVDLPEVTSIMRETMEDNADMLSISTPVEFHVGETWGSAPEYEEAA